MDKVDSNDLNIVNLGPGTIWSPLHRLADADEASGNFVHDEQRILLDDTVAGVQDLLARNEPLPSFEMAGPRRKIFFDPEKTACGIVTCGGLCPGLNDVIRGLVMQLNYRYGVRKIYGFKYGYEGFIPEYGHEVVHLTTEFVNNIHRFGGTVLGTSRGPQDIGRILDRLDEFGINILFVIGGDGTLRGALDISQQAQQRGRPISVIGIPKTIDNDIMFMDKSFGYETAFAAAVNAIQAAHTESQGSRNGIGLVKLMGRHSGFITCSAVLATNEVNFALIPEVPFALEGEQGLLEVVRHRVETRKHAVIVVAEGAGQDLTESSSGETGFLRQRAAQGHRPAFESASRAIFQIARHGDQPQVHRSQLHHPRSPRLAAGHRLLHAPRAKRRSRSHGAARPPCSSRAGTAISSISRCTSPAPAASASIRKATSGNPCWNPPGNRQDFVKAAPQLPPPANFPRLTKALSS